jgi:hypothetical protein
MQALLNREGNRTKVDALRINKSSMPEAESTKAAGRGFSSSWL